MAAAATISSKCHSPCCSPSSVAANSVRFSISNQNSWLRPSCQIGPSPREHRLSMRRRAVSVTSNSLVIGGDRQCGPFGHFGHGRAGLEDVGSKAETGAAGGEELVEIV